jgi:hypothetical protein
MWREKKKDKEMIIVRKEEKIEYKKEREYDKSIHLLSSRITLGLTPRKTSIAAILSLID